MKICKVKNTNLYDVFIGEGWKNHARVYFKQGKLSFVGKDNVRLSNTQLQTLQIKLLMETQK